MSYQITHVQFVTAVPLRGAFVFQVKASEGYEISFDQNGFVLVTRPSWRETYHYGPNFIATLTSEPTAPPAPQEPTVVTRLPRRDGKKAA